MTEPLEFSYDSLKKAIKAAEKVWQEKSDDKIALQKIQRIFLGFNFSEKDKNGDTILTWAIKNIQPHVVADIIKLLPDVAFKNIRKVRDKEGDTALTLAAAKGFTGITKILLSKAKALQDIDVEELEAALVLAIQSGHVGTVRELLQEADIIPDAQNTVFKLAASNGQTEIVKDFLLHIRLGVKLDAFILAAKNGRLKTVQMLFYDIGVKNLKDTDVIREAFKSVNDGYKEDIKASAKDKKRYVEVGLMLLKKEADFHEGQVTESEKYETVAELIKQQNFPSQFLVEEFRFAIEKARKSASINQKATAMEYYMIAGKLKDQLPQPDRKHFWFSVDYNKELGDTYRYIIKQRPEKPVSVTPSGAAKFGS